MLEIFIDLFMRATFFLYFLVLFLGLLLLSIRKQHTKDEEPIVSLNRQNYCKCLLWLGIVFVAYSGIGLILFYTSGILSLFGITLNN